MLTALGSSEVLLSRPTACGSCSTQAACQAAAVAVAANRAIGLFDRFAEQQRVSSRPGDSITKEDALEAGKAAILTISSAVLTTVQQSA